MTTYSFISLSCPDPATNCPSRNLVRLCRDRIRTTACRSPAPSIGKRAARSDTVRRKRP